MVTSIAPHSAPRDSVTRPPVELDGGRSSQRRVLDKLLAATFGDMVTIMMQSPAHRQVAVSELAQRLVPPLLKRQYKMAQAVNQATGQTQPVALVVWARVSDALHERFVAAPEMPITLSRDEWSSGDNYWIVDVIGEDRFVKPLIDGLLAKDMSGKRVHCRERTEGGAAVRVLGPKTTDA